MRILEELLPGELWIYQKQGGVRPGTDAVLLSAFCEPGEDEAVLEIGSGSGAIALLLAHIHRCRVTAVEIQEEYARLARDSAAYNGLQGRIEVRCEDIRRSTLKKESFDFVAVNPPYYSLKEKVSRCPERAIARSEVFLSLKELAESIDFHLRAEGRAALIYPARRESELLRTLEEFGLYPYKVVALSRRESEPPFRVLVGAVKGARPRLTRQAMHLRNKEGESEALRDCYRRLGIARK